MVAWNVPVTIKVSVFMVCPVSFTTRNDWAEVGVENQELRVLRSYALPLLQRVEPPQLVAFAKPMILGSGTVNVRNQP